MKPGKVLIGLNKDGGPGVSPGCLEWSGRL